MKNAFRMPGSRRSRMWALAACLSAIALLPVGSKLACAPDRPASRLSPLQISQRALEMSAVLGEPMTETTRPVYAGPSCWTLTCQSPDLQLFLMLDDAGRLCRLRTSFNTNVPARLVAPINTPAEAREVGLHRLTDLHIVTKGDRLTLERAPVALTATPAWRMVWTVASPDAASPSRIALVLDRRTGFPLLLWKGAQGTVDPYPPAAR